MAQRNSPDDAAASWCYFAERLQASPKEFYEFAAAAVARLAIPEAVIERIDYREGGAFSAAREYLRVRRRREVFDVCGAPFGNGFFFSWWLAELRPALPPIVTILIIFGYLVILGVFVRELGFFQGPVVLAFLIPLLLWGISHMGTANADDFILMLPFIGPVYERVFRPITYYRVDTSRMFQKAVEGAVQEAVDQLTSSKGVRALAELERKPVMRDFFKK